MTDARRIWEAADYDAMIEIIVARKNELNLSDEAVDNRANLARGHTGKILCAARLKKLGALTMFALPWAVGLKIAFVEDTEALATLADEGDVRKRPPFPAHTISKALIERVKPAINRQIGERLTEGRKRIPRWKRRRIARHAALARHGKRRPKRTPSRAQDTSPAVSPASQAPANPRPQCVGTGAATSQGPAPSVGRPA